METGLEASSAEEDGKLIIACPKICVFTILQSG